MHDVFKMLDIERIFWKVDIKPGMPTLARDYIGRWLCRAIRLV